MVAFSLPSHAYLMVWVYLGQRFATTTLFRLWSCPLLIAGSTWPGGPLLCYFGWGQNCTRLRVAACGIRDLGLASEPVHLSMYNNVRTCSALFLLVSGCIDTIFSRASVLLSIPSGGGNLPKWLVDILVLIQSLSRTIHYLLQEMK